MPWGPGSHELPPIDGIGLRRTDVAVDGRRGALLGLELTNPGREARTVRLWVDAHSELMTQYPWGFDGTVPNATDNAPDTASFDDRTLMFRDTGRLPGETADHSYTAIVGSNRTPVAGSTGPGGYGAFGEGRRCTATQTPAPMPRECDDGPFGRGTGGRLEYEVRVRAGGTAALAGSRWPARRAPRPRRGASSAGWPARPAACSSSSSARARRSAAGRASTCRATGPCRPRSTGASRTWPTSRRSRATSRSAGPTGQGADARG
jgi:hypothetical protein